MNKTIRELGKRAFSLVLALSMILSLSLVSACAEGEGNLLTDGSFETDIWSGSPWAFAPDTWDNTTIAWSDGAAHDGSYSVNYWSASAQTITASQSVTLEAGTYTLTAYDQGADSTLQLFAGESTGETISLTGWGTWDSTEFTFTIEEAGEYKVGAYLNCADGGWGYLDNMTLVRAAEEDNDIPTEGYYVSVSADKTAPAPGDTVTLSIEVYLDGQEVTPENLTTWLDYWNDHSDGNQDATIDAPNALSTTVTLPSEGTYYLVTEVYDSGWNILASATTTFNVSAAGESGSPATSSLYVEKVENLADNFIMGVDISSVISEFNSGVVYYDFDGNEIDNVTDFCKFLAKCGVTHVRVRIWNDPYDENGNGYGGGNNDVATAVEIAKGCAAAGLKLLVDFHFSDFWADPGRQLVPKAWADLNLTDKASALAEFTTDALTEIADTGADIDMVQVGNETNGGMAGVFYQGYTPEGNSYEDDLIVLFKAGTEAVRKFNKDIQIVIHITNPEAGNMTKRAKLLADNGVDYDILGTSYYPYWHGTLENLQEQIEAVRNTYGKDVVVVETGLPYTADDTDGQGNNVTSSPAPMTAVNYPYTVQGQATFLRDLIDTVNTAGGLGVYYWEPAWITVGDTTGLSGSALDEQYYANKALWEKYGSGWASDAAAKYDPENVGTWAGGSSWDNQALFAADGTPLASAAIWNLVRTGAVTSDISVDGIEAPSQTIETGETPTLPETVTVNYNTGDAAEPVEWEQADIDVNTPGVYQVNGTVTFSREVTSGTYAGQATAPVTFTLTVKAPNLIPADIAGFEVEDGGAYTIGGTGISSIPASDDPYEGTHSMHWYDASAGIGTVTYNEVITLAPGKYTFEAVAQGYAGDTVTLNILDAAGNVLFSGAPTAMNGWANWLTSSVSFEVTEETGVQVQVEVNFQDGGWGTADCLYLYQTEAAQTDDGEEPSNPDDNQQPSNPDDGQQPSTDGEQQPSTDGEQQPSNPDDGQQPSNPDDGQQPSTDGEQQPSNPDDGQQPSTDGEQQPSTPDDTEITGVITTPNDGADAPKTGDEAAIGLWVIALSVSAAGAALLALSRKRWLK